MMDGSISAAIPFDMGTWSQSFQGPHIPQLKSSVRQLGLNSFGATELSKLTWAFAKVDAQLCKIWSRSKMATY